MAGNGEVGLTRQYDSFEETVAELKLKIEEVVTDHAEIQRDRPLYIAANKPQAMFMALVFKLHFPSFLNGASLNERIDLSGSWLP